MMPKKISHTPSDADKRVRKQDPSLSKKIATLAQIFRKAIHSEKSEDTRSIKAHKIEVDK